MSTFQPMDHELVTPRLRLRRERPADAEAIRGVWVERDPRSKRLIDADGHPTDDEMRERLAAHGQGYATEAAGAVLDAARATGRSRIWASVREWNAPSLKVLGRLGFSDSGRRLVDADLGDTLWMTLEL